MRSLSKSNQNICPCDQSGYEKSPLMNKKIKKNLGETFSKEKTLMLEKMVEKKSSDKILEN